MHHRLAARSSIGPYNANDITIKTTMRWIFAKHFYDSCNKTIRTYYAWKSAESPHSMRFIMKFRWRKNSSCQRRRLNRFFVTFFSFNRQISDDWQRSIQFSQWFKIRSDWFLNCHWFSVYLEFKSSLRAQICMLFILHSSLCIGHPR